MTLVVATTELPVDYLTPNCGADRSCQNFGPYKKLDTNMLGPILKKVFIFIFTVLIGCTVAPMVILMVKIKKGSQLSCKLCCVNMVYN